MELRPGGLQGKGLRRVDQEAGRGEEDNPAEWEQRLKTEVEERTREKFTLPVGPWTPVDRRGCPSCRASTPINPLTSLDTVKYPATLASQGTKTGERVLIQFEIQARHLKTLADLGMREKMQEQLTELLQRPKGFLLFSALPAGGLRTTIDVVLQGMDRFLREFAAVEEERNRGREIENVAVTTYKAAEGQSPAAVLMKVFRSEPNVVLVRDLPDAETVSLICRELSASDRLVMGSIRAKDCAEALLRVLMLEGAGGGSVRGGFRRVVPATRAETVRPLQGSLCPRPAGLAATGHSPGARAGVLSPPPAQARRGKKGHLPRVRRRRLQGPNGDLRIVDAGRNHRQGAGATPKLDLLRQAARKAGMKSLQEEGILLVARGVTSLPELMRVMKQ